MRSGKARKERVSTIWSQTYYILLLLHLTCMTNPLPFPCIFGKIEATCTSQLAVWNLYTFILFLSSQSESFNHLSLAGQQSGQRVSGPGNPVGAKPKVALGGSWRGPRCGEPAEKVKVASKYWKVKVTLKVKRAQVASISTFPGYAEPRPGWSGGSRCWTTDEWDTGRPLRV